MYALFVNNLHPNVTEELLASRLTPAGHIHSVHLCKDRKTRSPLGYAYVNFRHLDDAERAIEMFNFEHLLGRPMRVMWSRWDGTVSTPTTKANLFLKNLDKSIDSTALFDTFSSFGKVLSCKVVSDENGSKGYGYVQFESEEASNVAMERLNGKLLNDRQVTIERFKSWEERETESGRPTAPYFTHSQMPMDQAQAVGGRTTIGHNTDWGPNLFIKNLEDFVDDACLRWVFEQFGTIINAKVMMKNGRSRGFGFVTFSSTQEATEAMRMTHGMRWGRKWLYVDFCKPMLPPCYISHQAKNLVKPHMDMYQISVPATEADSLADSVPAAEAEPSDDNVQATKVDPLEYSAPVANAGPSLDSVVAAEARLLKDSVPGSKADQLVGWVLGGEADPLDNSAPVPKADILEDSVSVTEVDPSADSVLITVADLLKDSGSGSVTDALKEIVSSVEADLLKDSDLAAEADPLEDSVLAAEADPMNDSILVAKDFLLEDSDQKAEAEILEDSLLAAKANRLEDSVTGAAADPLEDSVSGREADPLNSSTLAAKAEMLEDGVKDPEVDSSEDSDSDTLEARVCPVEADPLEDCFPAADLLDGNIPGNEADPLGDIILTVEDGQSADSVLTAKTGSSVEIKHLSTYPPSWEHLTLSMLESAPLDEQIQMAYDCIFPLIREIHPCRAKKITRMLVKEENNQKIMKMIEDTKFLCTRVSDMDALLTAKKASHNLGKVCIFKNNSNKKRRKTKKQ